MAGTSEWSAAYTDVHRYIARSFLAGKVVDEKELIELVRTADARCLLDRSTTTLSDAVEILSAVNSKIAAHGFGVVKRMDEMSGLRKFILVSKNLTEELRVVEADWLEEEKKVFGSIIDGIMNSTERRLSVDEAKRIMRGSPVRSAGLIVEDLLRRDWLTLCEDKVSVTLGFRALVEQEDYLVNRYGLSCCALCYSVIFISSYKTCTACQSVFHQQCLDCYVDSTSRLPDRKCPCNGCTAQLSDCIE